MRLYDKGNEGGRNDQLQKMIGSKKQENRVVANVNDDTFKNEFRKMERELEMMELEHSSSLLNLEVSILT